MILNTHLDSNTSLSGKVTALEQGYAEVLLHTTQQMVVDAQGLVHGGFIFSAADLSAMAAVNNPYVVLGAASSRFIAPVNVHDTVVCKAIVLSEKGKKKVVDVQAFVKERLVFEGQFSTYVLEQHVLD